MKTLTINNLYDISVIFNQYQEQIEVEGKYRKPTLLNKRWMNVDQQTRLITSGRNDFNNIIETNEKDWTEEHIKGLINIINNPYAKYAVKMIYDYGWEVKVITAKNYCGEIFTGFKIFDKEYIDYIDIDVKSFYEYCVRDYLTKDLRREQFNKLITRIDY